MIDIVCGRLGTKRGKRGSAPIFYFFSLPGLPADFGNRRQPISSSIPLTKDSLPAGRPVDVHLLNSSITASSPEIARYSLQSLISLNKGKSLDETEDAHHPMDKNKNDPAKDVLAFPSSN